MKKKLYIAFIFLFIVLITINTVSFGAEYSFKEVNYDIDNISIDRSMFNGVTNINDSIILSFLGFNLIYIPYFIVAIYIIMQIYYMKKYKKIKQNLSISTITILIISIITIIIQNFIINKNGEPVFVTSTIYETESSYIITTVNIVINSIILIIGLILQNRIIKKYKENNINKKSIILALLLVVTLVIISILIYNMPKVLHMHIVESDWSFGRTYYKRKYNIQIEKDKIISNISGVKIKVIDINEDGVLIEYTRKYYEKKNLDEEKNVFSRLGNYEYKTEVVQQKMLWNVNYIYNEDYDPLNDVVDARTNYYIRFEK